MPEGPEIWRAAQGLARVLDGREVERAEFTQKRLHNYGNALSGQRVIAVTARGKALVTRFDNGLALYSHNQLYGRWYIVRRDKLPKTNRTLRVGLHTAEHSALLYSASDIEVLDEAGLGHHPYLARLGPEALDDAVVWRDIVARMDDPRFRRRSLASLYLDQHFVAGIGNYLRSEILHAAKLDPKARPVDLGRGEKGRLARATLDLTRQSLATKGVTNRLSRAQKLKRGGMSYGRYRFAVFSRAGEACYECGGEIQRREVGSRRLYVCPSCQNC